MYYYEKAGGLNHGEILQLLSPSEPCLRPIILAFAANVARIESAWLLLPFLVDSTMNGTILTMKTVHKVLGTLDIDDPRQLDPEIKKRLESEYVRTSISEATKYANENGMDRAISRLNHVLEHSALPFIKTAVETTLASQIMNAWTTAESLSKDLWVSALNYGPKEWASKIMAGSSMKSRKDQERSVSISSMQRYKYDISNKLGNIFREKISFETAKEVISAYEAVFGADVKKHIPETTSRLVTALEASRNLFAHRGGIVDRVFMGKVSGIECFKDLEFGSQLIIDGKMAGELTWAGIGFSVGLLAMVDFHMKQADAVGWFPQI